MEKNIRFVIFSLVLFCNQAFAQLLHSHNDYEQKEPFFAAYNLGFDSIEADLYIKSGKLYVAHDEKDITKKRTFKALYWKPLLSKIKANKGYAYSDKKELYILLDLKKEGKLIMTELEKMVKRNKKDLQHVHITISGDMPKPEEFGQYDKLFFFDGRRNIQYSEEAYKRVDMVSASFLDFGKYWPGKEQLSEETYQNIRAFVMSNHAKGKRVRIWGTPNTILSFETLKKLGVDFIGTDDLDLLKNFVDK
ncbi:PI-PLC domain-containing protein [Emticicia fontis]